MWLIVFSVLTSILAIISLIGIIKNRQHNFYFLIPIYLVSIIVFAIFKNNPKIFGLISLLGLVPLIARIKQALIKRNIIFKGKYTDESQIKTGHLPSDAVVFKEPNTIIGLMLSGLIVSIPIIAITFTGLILKVDVLAVNYWPFMLMVVLSLILGYPHEIIHALCFPNESTKEIWWSIEVMFVYCNTPISKKRFIWMSAAPNIILGFIPFSLFMLGVFDFNYSISEFVGIISWFVILSGVGDYLNIFNAIRQVPRHANVINYGIHSYWVRDASNRHKIV